MRNFNTHNITWLLPNNGTSQYCALVSECFYGNKLIKSEVKEYNNTDKNPYYKKW